MRACCAARRGPIRPLCHRSTRIPDHRRRHTYVEQAKGESINDRNDRAIRVAAKWYQDHIGEAFPEVEDAKVVFLTNDAGNLRQAKELGLNGYTGDACRGLKRHTAVLSLSCNVALAPARLASLNRACPPGVAVHEYVQKFSNADELTDLLAHPSDESAR